MNWKDVLILIIIFIIGSLIVSLIVSPTSFQGFTNNVKSIIPNNPSANPNTIKLVPSEMEEYGFYKDLYKSCIYLEAGAESQGISNVEQKACTEACGKRNMSYYSNTCDKDLLVYYCVQ